MTRFFFTTFLLFALAVPAAIAEVAQEITWDNLVPPLPPLEGPFVHLSYLQNSAIERDLAAL